MKDNYVKPGWKTTEFWSMIMCAFFGVLILTGIITNKESNDMLAFVNNIMGSLVTIVSVASYIFSRGKAKGGVIDYTKLVEDIERLVNSHNEKLEEVINLSNERIISKIISKD